MDEDDRSAGCFHAGFDDRRNSAALSVSNDSQLRELAREFLGGFFGLIGGTVIHDQHFEGRRQFRQNIQQFSHLPSQRGFGVMDGKNNTQRLIQLLILVSRLSHGGR